jgi:hypothetical protein
MQTDTVSGWMNATDSWREALRTAATVFVALAGLHVLMGVLSLTSFAWAKVLQAAAFGVAAGLLRRAGPLFEQFLRAVAPEQLRVTLSALLVAAGFFGMGMILSLGESSAPLEDWPVWLGLSLLMGFVLAVVGAAETKAGTEGSTRR